MGVASVKGVSSSSSPGGEGLRVREVVARALGGGHGTLLDGPHRLARLPVEDVEKRRLARLYDRADSFAVHGDVSEGRGSDGVVLPDVMVHHLEVPDFLPGLRVQGHEAVRVQVFSGTVAPVVRRGRGGQGNVDVAQLFVGGNATPGAEVPGALPRLFSPGLVSLLARSGNHVEGPEETTGAGVETSHVLGRRVALPPAVPRP